MASVVAFVPSCISDRIQSSRRKTGRCTAICTDDLSQTYTKSPLAVVKIKNQ